MESSKLKFSGISNDETNGVSLHETAATMTEDELKCVDRRSRGGASMQQLREELIRGGCKPEVADARVAGLRKMAAEFSELDAENLTSQQELAELEGVDPDDGESSVTLSNHEKFSFRLENWPLIASASAVEHGEHLEICVLNVRRSHGGYLIYGSRCQSRLHKYTGIKADVWMTDLLIAIRAAAKELQHPRLLESIIDRLPAEDWTSVASALDSHRHCSISVRQYVDGRHVVYGGITDEGGQRTAFRVSGPSDLHLSADVRKLASELGVEHLTQQLLSKIG